MSDTTLMSNLEKMIGCMTIRDNLRHEVKNPPAIFGFDSKSVKMNIKKLSDVIDILAIENEIYARGGRPGKDMELEVFVRVEMGYLYGAWELHQPYMIWKTMNKMVQLHAFKDRHEIDSLVYNITKLRAEYLQTIKTKHLSAEITEEIERVAATFDAPPLVTPKLERT